jgi:hypothetical protein
MPTFTAFLAVLRTLFGWRESDDSFFRRCNWRVPTSSSDLRFGPPRFFTAALSPFGLLGVPSDMPESALSAGVVFAVDCTAAWYFFIAAACLLIILSPVPVGGFGGTSSPAGAVVPDLPSSLDFSSRVSSGLVSSC